MNFAKLFKTVIVGLLFTSTALALDLDWSGQFRMDSTYIQNYTFQQGNVTNDAARTNAEGYYIPGGGEPSTFFQSLFARLNPKVIVNDNIDIKSEFWLGDPIYGFYGSGLPFDASGRYWYSSNSRGSVITAQRLWGEFQTDFGTIILGRAPLNWGLGIVWDAGDDIWSRYVSTGDQIRIHAKFGSFYFSPAFIKYNQGNNIGGACLDPTTPSLIGGLCDTTAGGSSVTDYNLQVKYDNEDEGMELGLNFVRRLGGSQQSTSGFLGVEGGGAGMTYTLWDIYAEKTFGPVTLAGEVPLVSGSIGNLSYSSFALAFDTKWKISSQWDIGARFGHAPGQPSESGTPGEFRAFYFNPNYKLGLIMFNLQTFNFAGPSTQNNPNTSAGDLRSPYDNPIVNVNYIALQGGYHLNDKWSFSLGWIYARAIETASAGNSFFNYWLRKTVSPAADNQSASYGWEADAGVKFRWDEALAFNFDFGWFFPGDYFAFSNLAGSPNGVTNSLAFRFGVAVDF